jgi:hypothetical protein
MFLINFSLLFFNNSISQPPSDTGVHKMPSTYKFPFWFVTSKFHKFLTISVCPFTVTCLGVMCLEFQKKTKRLSSPPLPPVHFYKFLVITKDEKKRHAVQDQTDEKRVKNFSRKSSNRNETDSETET